MNKNRVLVALLRLLAATLLVTAIASAQSLGDVARAQRAKKAGALKASRVYTNDDLPRVGGLSTTSTAAPAPESKGAPAEKAKEGEAKKPTAEEEKAYRGISTRAQQDAEYDVPYVPTPENVVAEMLTLADLNRGDVLYDLGSGDGRIVIMAAQKFGVRGVGIDINPERIKEARENASKAGVTDLVTFRQNDLFQEDISRATVVTLYLLPEVNLRLRPKLFKELKPGSRVVSHDFDMGDWKPDKEVKLEGHKVYYWVIPATGPEKANSH